MNELFSSYLHQHIQFNIEEFCNTLSFDNVIADLFISNKCNLKCRHCYFGNTSNIGASLTTNEWINVIDKLYMTGIRHFHFSGKESSLCEASIDLMHYIKSLPQTYAGIVSNGLGSIDYYERLLQTNIDYLEFSVDGLKDNHNFIRGGDFFDKTYSCIKNLKDHVHKFNLTTCLNKYNFNDYIDLISKFHYLGITHFFVTPFILKGRAINISDASLTIDEYAMLIQNLFTFLQQMLDTKLRIRCCIPIKYTHDSFKYCHFFKRILTNYFEKGEEPIYKINDNIIQLSFQYIDIDYVNTITISNDGYIIPCADDISNNQYYLFSLGNIKDIDVETLKDIRKTVIYNQSLFFKNYENQKSCKKEVW